MDSIWVLLIPPPYPLTGPVHQIDPSADTLIIIPPPSEPFAPWSKDATASSPPRKSALRIHVSSKHLALASPLFHKKLAHFSRNTSVQSDGRIHLYTAPRFDAKAAAIVLDAVHAKAFSVPRSVDLETLGQVALFAHTFGLVEAVSVFAELWVARLGRGVPREYGREVVLWVYVGWVFGLAEEFREATRVVAVESEGRVRKLGLPIGEGVVDAIDERRQELVEKALGIVYEVFDGLSDGTAACKSHCDSLLLGELVKILSKTGILWPRPGKPYSGVSYSGIVAAVEKLLQGRGQNQGQQGGRVAAADQSDSRTSQQPNGVKKANGIYTNGVNGIGIVGINGHANGVDGHASAEKANGHPRPSASQSNGECAAHHCDATRLVASLGRLKLLADKVEGPELDKVLR